MSDIYGSAKSGSGSTPSEGSGSPSGGSGSPSDGGGSGSPSDGGGGGSSGGSDGSVGCAFVITGVMLGGTDMVGEFDVSNTGAVPLFISGVTQGVGGPSYDTILFSPGDTIAPGNSTHVTVTSSDDIRGTTFELLTDCSNAVGEWPVS